jgi:hypothetical protein
MWRTWIQIEIRDNSLFKSFQDTIREKLQPILQLQKSGKINWFYFLFHSKHNDPNNLYFDVVFTTESDPKDILPNYCIDTAKIPPMMEIDGVDEKLLEGEDIRKAWRIIGEQSEFMINLVCSHQENVEIPPAQIAQFMHFFMNQLGYGKKSLFFPKAPIDRMKIVVSQPSMKQMTVYLGGEMRLF